ncbi:FecR domain-containing protein [Thermodesulfobacteriota bacterium]
MKKYIIASLLSGIFIIFGLNSLFSFAAEPASRGNTVSKDMLPAELKGMEVKDYYIKLDSEKIGKVIKTKGNLIVLHKETGQAYFAAKGDSLYGNDTLYTLKDSRCRVGFVTGDIITMAGDTTISAEEIVNDREGRKKKSVFSMAKGKAMFYVMRLLGYKDVDTSVKTRTAVMGVRGTKFGVEVVPGSEKMGQGRRIVIADSSNYGFEMMAEAGQQGGNAGYSKLIVFAGRVFGLRTDGKLVELEAGETALFGETETKVYGTTKEDVRAFLDAVGAEALRGFIPEGEGEKDTFEEDLDELLEKLQEDGFILDAEPEQPAPPPMFVTPSMAVMP